MKAGLGKVRLSRKLLLVLGSVLLLAGASGAAAVLIGSEHIMGPSYKTLNGLECTIAQSVTIKKNGTVWIRKYIRVNGGEGIDRLKTALRVAQGVYDKEKADLIQVSVLDDNGPVLRADMRGRAVGAQVVHIPDLAKTPEGTQAQTYSAYYLDGAPNGSGNFYGLRIDMPLEDIERMTATLTDRDDCTDPAATPEPGDAKSTDDVKAPTGNEEKLRDKPDINPDTPATAGDEASVIKEKSANEQQLLTASTDP